MPKDVGSRATEYHGASERLRDRVENPVAPMIHRFRRTRQLCRCALNSDMSTRFLSSILGLSSGLDGMKGRCGAKPTRSSLSWIIYTAKSRPEWLPRSSSSIGWFHPLRSMLANKVITDDVKLAGPTISRAICRATRYSKYIESWSTVVLTCSLPMSFCQAACRDPALLYCGDRIARMRSIA